MQLGSDVQDLQIDRAVQDVQRQVLQLVLRHDLQTNRAVKNVLRQVLQLGLGRVQDLQINCAVKDV